MSSPPLCLPSILRASSNPSAPSFPREQRRDPSAPEILITLIGLDLPFCKLLLMASNQSVPVKMFLVPKRKWKAEGRELCLRIRSPSRPGLLVAVPILGKSGFQKFPSCSGLFFWSLPLSPTPQHYWAMIDKSEMISFQDVQCDDLICICIVKWLSQSSSLTHPSPHTVLFWGWVWWEHLGSTLSKFQIYSRVLLPLIITLYIWSPEFIHLATLLWSIFIRLPLLVKKKETTFYVTFLNALSPYKDVTD